MRNRTRGFFCFSSRRRHTREASDWSSDVCSSDLAIVVANRPMCDLLGYAPSELQGQSVELLVPERFRLAHIGHRILFTDDRRDRTMERGHGLLVRCKDGSELRVAISLGSVPHGLETLTVAAIRVDARHTS